MTGRHLQKRGLRAFGLVAACGLTITAGVAMAEDGVGAKTLLLGTEVKTNSASTEGENLGFWLAFKEINDAGGIHGRKIEWKGYSRKLGQTKLQVDNAIRLVEQDKVFALVNFGGPAAIQIAKYVEKKEVPYLFPHTALVDSKGLRWVFTSFPTYRGEAKVMFKYLAQDRGLKKLAIVHDANVYGRLFLGFLQSYAQPYGYTVTGSVAVKSKGPKDLTKELKDLIGGGADAVVMALYPAQARTLMNAKAALNWTKGRMISVGPLTEERYLTLPDGKANGTLGYCYYPDPNYGKEPGVVAYRAAMAKYHSKDKLDRYSLYGYVFGKLIAAGLQKAGRDLTRKGFVAAMESIRNWDAGGVMPPVSLSPTDHHAQKAGFICEMKDGKFTALSGWISPAAD